MLQSGRRVCNFEWKLIYMQDFFKSPQLLAESKYFIFVRKSWENSICLQLPSPSDGSALLSDSQFISLGLWNSKPFLRNIVDTLFKYLFLNILHVKTVLLRHAFNIVVKKTTLNFVQFIVLRNKNTKPSLNLWVPHSNYYGYSIYSYFINVSQIACFLQNFSGQCKKQKIINGLMINMDF